MTHSYFCVITKNGHAGTVLRVFVQQSARDAARYTQPACILAFLLLLVPYSILFGGMYII